MCIPRRRRTANNERCCNQRSVLQLCTAGRVRAERRLYPCTGRVPLVQLVGDDRTSSWLFGLQLCITQVLVAPLAWYAGSRIAPLANRAQLRPLVYMASIAVVCLLEHAVLWLARACRTAAHCCASCRWPPEQLRAGHRAGGAHPELYAGQSLGFGLGSGLGYLLAVLLVTEARTACAARPSRKHSAACPSRWCISACWRWPSMALPDIL